MALFEAHPLNAGDGHMTTFESREIRRCYVDKKSRIRSGYRTCWNHCALEQKGSTPSRLLSQDFAYTALQRFRDHCTTANLERVKVLVMSHGLDLEKNTKAYNASGKVCNFWLRAGVGLDQPEPTGLEMF